MATASRRHKLLVSAGLAGVVLALAAFAFWRMTEAALFTPLTVAQRVAERGETLDPQPSDPAPDRWQVTRAVALHHVSTGSGRPVLFVHGGPGFPPAQLPAALAQLAADHAVHAYDHRGCGASTRPLTRPPAGSFYSQLQAVEAELGLAEQLADIERIRRRLGVPQLTLVGHSFGGLIAALYAAEFPEHVSHLLLVAPAALAVMPKAGPDLFELVRAKLPEGERAAYDAYLKQYFDFGAALALDDAALAQRYAEFQRYYALAARTPPALQPSAAGGYLVLATYASLGRRHDYRPALQRICRRDLFCQG